MKNFLIGLVLGILLIGAVGYFIFLPDAKDASYKTGYQDGNTKGTADGKAAGITEGMAQTEAKYQHQRDSIAQADSTQALAEREKKAAEAKMHRVKPVQNWHVINGKIGEPIKNEPKKSDQ
jgi:hypothetical protein